MRVFAILPIAGLMITTPALAKSDLSLVSAFAKSVRKGENLEVLFPAAINPTDAAALRKFTGCGSDAPIRRKKGQFVIIFTCGRKSALGAEIGVADGRLLQVTTFQVVKVEERVVR